MSNSDFTSKGLSGCSLFLQGDIVRKTSGSESYNSRLKAQCNKQNSFKSEIFKKPEILNEGYTETGLFFFDMEYVKGKVFGDFITEESTSSFIYKLEQHIDIQFSGKNKEYEYGEFVARLLDKLYSINIEQKSLKYFRDFLVEKLPSIEFDLRMVPTHGDLSLNNIIIRDGEFYLIDFLDSFIDSIQIDLAKVMQDIRYGWSDRLASRSIQEYRTSRIEDVMLKYVRQEELQYFEAITILRIVPYIKDRRQLRILMEMLKLNLYYAQFIDSGWGKKFPF